MTDSNAKRGLFVIGDDEVPFPDFEERPYDMDEAMIFYDYTGYPIEDLIVTDDMDDEETADREKRLRSPHVLSALMHIGYRRAHPKAKDSNVRKLVKATSFVTAMGRMADVEDDEAEADEVPPSEESTSTPSESLTNGSLDSKPTNEPQKPTSGTGSTTGSDQPDGTREPTGESRSATHAQPSAPETLALSTPLTS